MKDRARKKKSAKDYTSQARRIIRAKPYPCKVQCREAKSNTGPLGTSGEYITSAPGLPFKCKGHNMYAFDFRISKAHLLKRTQTILQAGNFQRRKLVIVVVIPIRGNMSWYCCLYMQWYSSLYTWYCYISSNPKIESCQRKSNCNQHKWRGNTADDQKFLSYCTRFL